MSMTDNDLAMLKARAIRASAQKPTATCCNADCEWSGSIKECVMCGSVGPLCPECHEVVEPDTDAAFIVACREAVPALIAELSALREARSDHQRLVRELDAILCGEAGAAKQASLCDLVGYAQHQLAGMTLADLAGATQTLREACDTLGMRRHDSAKEQARAMVSRLLNDRTVIASLELRLKDAATQKPCRTCNGHGVVGGHSGQTAESYSFDAEPCPDCNAPIHDYSAEARSTYEHDLFIPQKPEGGDHV